MLLRCDRSRESLVWGSGVLRLIQYRLLGNRDSMSLALTANRGANGAGSI